MRITVEHLSGSKAGQVEELSGPSITAGRNPQHSLAFDPEIDADVSGNHAELRLDPGGRWTIADVGSRNGTFLNGSRVNGAVIVVSGSTIRFGENGPEILVTFEPPAPPLPPRPAPVAVTAPARALAPVPAPAPVPVPVPVPASNRKLFMAVGASLVLAIGTAAGVILYTKKAAPVAAPAPPSPKPATAAATPVPAPAGPVPTPPAPTAPPASAGPVEVAPPPAGKDANGDALPEGASARLGTTRLVRRNAGGVPPLAFSPIGKAFAAAAPDGKSVVLHDLATAGEIGRLPHDRRVDALAFSPDGKLLLAATDNATVHVWDAAAGRKSHALENPLPGEVIRSLAVSPDARLFACATRSSGAGSERLRLRDLAGGKEFRSFDDRGDGPSFSPDGTLVATTSGIVWEVATGRAPRMVGAGGLDELRRVAFVAGGRLISVHADGGVRLLDPREGAPGNRDIAREIRRLAGVDLGAGSLEGAVAASGEVAAAWKDAAIRIVEPASGAELRRAPHRDFAPVAFAPDGAHYAIAGAHAIRIVETRTGKDVHPGHGERVEAAAVSSDGKVAASADLDTVHVWDVRGQRLLKSFGAPRAGVIKLSISADGKVVARANGARVQVYDVEAGTELHRLQPERRPDAIAVAPRGKALALGTRGTAFATIVNLATGKELKTVEFPARLGGWIGFSPDGTILAATVEAAGGSQVALAEASTGRILRTLARQDLIHAAAFSPDGKVLALGLGGPPLREGGAIALVDVATGRPLRTIQAARSDVMVLAFSGDGATLVAGASRGERAVLSVFEVATGNELRRATWRAAMLDADRCAALPDGSAVIAPAREAPEDLLLWSLGAR